MHSVRESTAKVNHRTSSSRTVIQGLSCTPAARPRGKRECGCKYSSSTPAACPPLRSGLKEREGVVASARQARMRDNDVDKLRYGGFLGSLCTSCARYVCSVSTFLCTVRLPSLVYVVWTSPENSCALLHF